MTINERSLFSRLGFLLTEGQEGDDRDRVQGERCLVAVTAMTVAVPARSEG